VFSLGHAPPPPRACTTCVALAHSTRTARLTGLPLVRGRSSFLVRIWADGHSIRRAGRQLLRLCANVRRCLYPPSLPIRLARWPHSTPALGPPAICQFPRRAGSSECLVSRNQAVQPSAGHRVFFVGPAVTCGCRRSGSRRQGCPTLRASRTAVGTVRESAGSSRRRDRERISATPSRPYSDGRS
jgi:hypothetical protein